MSSQPDTQGAPATEPNPLLALQEVDLSIDRLETRLEALESQGEINEARSAVAGADARVGELRLEIDDVATRQRRLESDVDSIGRKIEAERTRLYDGSVAHAKELQAIEQEVASLANRKARMEDEVLELMEQREGLEERLRPLEAEAQELRDRLAELEVTSGREMMEIERALGERRAERQTVSTTLEAELLELYEDIRRQKRGVGAAALVDGICQGCHQKLSPVYLQQLRRSSNVWRCEYCRRILVPA